MYNLYFSIEYSKIKIPFTYIKQLKSKYLLFLGYASLFLEENYPTADHLILVPEKSFKYVLILVGKNTNI